MEVYGKNMIFLSHLLNCEKEYLELLGLGWSPQQARAVLPNALKAEIVVTANIREWRHIFKLRTGILDSWFNTTLRSKINLLCCFNTREVIRHSMINEIILINHIFSFLTKKDTPEER